MANRYRCTECDRSFDTFKAAAHCHWGIGGVIEIPDFSKVLKVGDEIRTFRADHYIVLSLVWSNVDPDVAVEARDKDTGDIVFLGTDDIDYIVR